MRVKKVAIRILWFILAIVMVLTCCPSMGVFADGSTVPGPGGSNGGNAGSGSYQFDKMKDMYGIRIYFARTADNDKTGKAGYRAETIAIDIDKNDMGDYSNGYRRVSGHTRVGGGNILGTECPIGSNDIIRFKDIFSLDGTNRLLDVVSTDGCADIPGNDVVDGVALTAALTQEYNGTPGIIKLCNAIYGKLETIDTALANKFKSALTKYKSDPTVKCMIELLTALSPGTIGANSIDTWYHNRAFFIIKR